MFNERAELDLNKYQEVATTFALYKHQVYPFLALAEEAGEVCGVVAKAYRKTGYLNDAPVNKLIDELGDVLWQLSACCTELGITLNDIAEYNLNKLGARQEEGTIVER